MDERAANAWLRARASAPDFEETWISSQIFHFRIAHLGKLAVRICRHRFVESAPLT